MDIFNENNDVDWEGMILAKQEAYEASEDCDGDMCASCCHAGFCPYYSEDDVFRG